MYVYDLKTLLVVVRSVGGRGGRVRIGGGRVGMRIAAVVVGVGGGETCRGSVRRKRHSGCHGRHAHRIAHRVIVEIVVVLDLRTRRHVQQRAVVVVQDFVLPISAHSCSISSLFMIKVSIELSRIKIEFFNTLKPGRQKKIAVALNCKCCK